MAQNDFTLSEDEMRLVQDPSWLLTKHRIISKVYTLFGSLSDEYRIIAGLSKRFLPQDILIPSPKISKGEQYMQLPYVILDYPRFFSREDTFAIRSMFWWGNYFSIHLMLSGKYKDAFAGNVLSRVGSQWRIGVNDDPWQHHFEPDNYEVNQNSNSSFDRYLSKPYFKLGAMHPLAEWAQAEKFYLESFKELLSFRTSPER